MGKDIYEALFAVDVELSNGEVKLSFLHSGARMETRNFEHTILDTIPDNFKIADVGKIDKIRR